MFTGESPLPEANLTPSPGAHPEQPDTMSNSIQLSPKYSSRQAEVCFEISKWVWAWWGELRTIVGGEEVL